jgi:hypothetical protein
MRLAAGCSVFTRGSFHPYWITGTGKTQTVVNTMMSAVAIKMNSVFLSSNSNAIQSFVDKVPPEIRPLILDVSLFEKKGSADLLTSIHKILQCAQTNPDTLKNKIEVRVI